MARPEAFWLLITLFFCFSFAKVHDSSLPTVASALNRERGQSHVNDALLLERSDSSIEKARKLVAKGQTAMARENARIMSRTSRRSQGPAPIFSKTSGSTETVPELQYEDQTLHTAGMGETSHGLYVVPTELVEAARIVAESTSLPQAGSFEFSDQSEYLNSERGSSDTFYMAPVLKNGDGTRQYTLKSGLAHRFADNGLKAAQLKGSDRDGKIPSSAWWMANIEQRGASPFAPKGYKVWRNVKDYGAKGDGKTDDTAAINRAISDGGRCGRNCSGSTIHPATVYIPPGLYLVSSSIIQYYNTEIIGDPVDMPRIVAAPSFVGLGVITTNVYESPDTQRYLNTRNSLRSVRNLYIDIRYTPQDAQVCGIHWQVSRGTSIENVIFWADPSPETTQQGIYIENGSGGFLSNILFLGGKYGVYMGNQQLTARDLWFRDVQEAAIQLRWTWGYTLQNINFKNVKTGINIMGDGEKTTEVQGVGSLVVTDVQGEAMDVFISSTLSTDNPTSLIVQNALMNDVDVFVQDEGNNKVLLAGDGDKEEILPIKSWGFGKVIGTSGNTTFVNGGEIAAPNRTSLLTQPGLSHTIRDIEYYFTRQRPRYIDLGGCDLIDVKAWGAKGDGKTDDTIALNRAFKAASDMSAVAYIPHGVYIIKDTVTIPVGSRVIGQTWPQLMGTGAKFENMTKPRPVVRVGVPGNTGVAEIQSVIFTVRGPTAGAVLLEWNVRESFQGSAGLWDSHFRVGGAEGSDLQASDCPKLPDDVNPSCIAASLMLHITPKASAYLENVWVWAADHDIDDENQTSIDVYAARGILIESTGPTWLWGTSVEHCTLYQYQLSGAKNVLLGLIQTESPYYQPHPASPGPFDIQLAAFADDPLFEDCGEDSTTCGLSWAARMIDSQTIYVLGTGMYSWFQEYDRECIDNGKGNCQDRIFYTEQTSDIWIYNLVTVGASEMISPFNGQPVNATENLNGFASSLLSWRGGINGTTGWREFDGYSLYSPDTLARTDFTSACQKALAARIKCHEKTQSWTKPRLHGPLLGPPSLTTWVCADGCKKSIDRWVESTEKLCKRQTWPHGAVAEFAGAFIQYGLREQCPKDESSGRWCTDVRASFKHRGSWDNMPKEQLCSDCFLGRLQMMQASPYSMYRSIPEYHDALRVATTRCKLMNQPWEPQPPVFPPKPKVEPHCLPGRTYVTREGDTCDSIAEEFSVSSATLAIGNAGLIKCAEVKAGVKICLPLECETYTLQEKESCLRIYLNTGVSVDEIVKYNSWLTRDCMNLHSVNENLGHTLCISPSGGEYKNTVNDTRGSTSSGGGIEYVEKQTPPPANARVADGTTERCGRWFVAERGQNCASATQNFLTASLFRAINPSLLGGDCTEKLVPGRAYCTGPLRDWHPWYEKHNHDL
ncbi:hypothetical protein FSARC_12921 [Fusarium sarcochroum]|uniref:LysM domain-containing protein n=1 Tax=Fusarium sarcochroum TaxID=1208366 RepID=A0A8H4WUM7_9HYPO|nr:hypothetical protein FSARC_12921 [Fusarium sarcochroum]